jgi:hypothetical protein
MNPNLLGGIEVGTLVAVILLGMVTVQVRLSLAAAHFPDRNTDVCLLYKLPSRFSNHKSHGASPRCTCYSLVKVFAARDHLVGRSRACCGYMLRAVQNYGYAVRPPRLADTARDVRRCHPGQCDPSGGPGALPL